MEISVMPYGSLPDSRKAIEYHEKHWKTPIEVGDRAGKEAAVEISVMNRAH